MLIVKRPTMRHPPCAVECRCDGNQVYALIGDAGAALRGESAGVIGFGDTLPDALRELADAIEKEVEPVEACERCGEPATHRRTNYDVCPTDRGDEVRFFDEWFCNECDKERN